MFSSYFLPRTRKLRCTKERKLRCCLTMGGPILYITKHQLRQLGFTQLDKEILPLLEAVNLQIAQNIDEEIPKEIMLNYDNALLHEYQDLRNRHDFHSPFIQKWLKEHIRGLQSIITDHQQMMLHKINLRIMEKN